MRRNGVPSLVKNLAVKTVSEFERPVFIFRGLWLSSDRLVPDEFVTLSSFLTGLSSKLSPRLICLKGAEPSEPFGPTVG